MSVQKLETVKAARKPQGKCTKCGDDILPGMGYVWWTPGFRSKYKVVRCVKPTCRPRPSELETTKAATILAAQESFADNLEGLNTKEDIEEAVHEVGSAIGEVRDEYQEAADAWENGNEQLQEKVDHYEAQASEVEDWVYDGADEPELCMNHQDADLGDPEVEDCDDCSALREYWLDEIRDAARDAVDSIEFA